MQMMILRWVNKKRRKRRRIVKKNGFLMIVKRKKMKRRMIRLKVERIKSRRRNRKRLN